MGENETSNVARSNMDETQVNHILASSVAETLPGRFELRTSNPWEEICGHTRAVRRGPFIIIAGTTASDPDKGVLYPDSAYQQSAVIFERMRHALSTFGAKLTDVVRIRMFVTDISDQNEVCRAFIETFHSYGIRVPATLVQISAFVDPRMRVEIEADAIMD